MAKNSLKKYLPTGLLGRAILILLFPIVLIEIIIGIAFIQRHFEQVTDQMSEGIALEIIFIRKELERNIQIGTPPNDLRTIVPKLGESFGFNTKFTPNSDLNPKNNVAFYDLAGKTFVKNINQK